MDNTRQKLLALIRGAAYDNTYCSSDGDPVCVISSPIVDPYLVELFTDYLLARGVTFVEDEAPTIEPQRWIPVTDHMPEDDERVEFFEHVNLKFATVLVYGKETGVYMANRINISPCGIKSVDEHATNGWEWSCGCKNVTHWRPMPKPPKEGE